MLLGRSVGVMMLALLPAALLTGLSNLQAARPYTPRDAVTAEAVAAPALSPDGAQVAYEVASTDFAANKRESRLFLVPAAGGAEPRQLTFAGSSRAAAWSPDGRSLAFLSSRGDKPEAQVYLLPVDRPGEARPLTSFPGGVEDVIFAPDGRHLVFAARVYPDAPSSDSAAARDSVKAASKLKAMVHDRLMYRHWDTYWDGKVTHLFRVTIAGDSLVDLTPGLKHDALNYWLASAGREFTVSADSKWVYFAGNQDEDQAVSYNTEVYRVQLAGGEPEQLSRNPAADNLPRPSPDGRWLAWRASSRPGYESDEYDLVLLDLAGGKLANLTGSFGRSVGGLFWSAAADTLFFEAEDEGDLDLFAVALAGGPVTRVLGEELGAGEGFHLDVLAPPGEESFIFLSRRYGYLNELASFDRGAGRLTLLSGHNRDLWKEVHVPQGEDFWYQGADGARVHGMLFKPIDFDPAKKYPLLVRVHGGPQQMFPKAFRHEYALFAGRGYVVFTCNPRGSTGYGQEFTDQIRGDWGGRVIEDIRRGVREVLQRAPYVDPQGIAAWGDSYGGFVANWLEGHNEDRMFATLISHAGDADQWSAYGSTEELWFPEWELHGPPWQSPKRYDQLSPIRYAANFRTPMLLTHGDLDWRVPVTGGEQMFTALQRQGIPSRLIRFPDEGHWIRKPQNAEFWYRSILDWADRWCQR